MSRLCWLAKNSHVRYTRIILCRAEWIKSRIHTRTL